MLNENDACVFLYLEKELGDDCYCFSVFGVRGFVEAFIKKYSIDLSKEKYLVAEMTEVHNSFAIIGGGRCSISKWVRNAKEQNVSLELADKLFKKEEK